jgi:DNA invertase Pin-like site-specific DNA recombinase
LITPTQPVDIYVRVSRLGGREHRITEAEQERRARELARDRGLKIGKVLPPDLDESGGKLDRPGLQEALRRVESGESGGIIVAWLDRLSRDSEQAHGLVRRIAEAGGRIYAPDAPSDWTTPEGELQAGIVFAFAQYIRSRARAGFERAKEQAIARGIPVHSRPAVGYRARPDRRLEPDPDVAPVVREVFERRARGEGPATLGAFLTSRGVPTSQGSMTWSKPAVYGLIANRTYLGELSYGKPPRFVNLAAHEPIVDLALWQAAQHPRGKRLAPLRSESGGYLLAGLARCATCGYSMQGTVTSRGKRIYRCTRIRAGGICPAPARVSAEALERGAVAAFWELTADLEAERRRDDSLDKIGELERELERASDQLAQWSSPEVQETIGDLPEYVTGLRERRKARDSAAGALGRARSVASDSPEVMPVGTLREAWGRMTTLERRQLLALRFDALAVGRDYVTVYPDGTAPAGLPRRGFRRSPELAPFPDPPRRARVLALK